MCVIEDANNEMRRLLAWAKMSNATVPATLAFRIENGPVVWEGIDPRSAQELMDQLDRANPEAKIEMARAFLRINLAHGPVESKNLEASAAEAGISARTLDRARSDLSVVPEQRDGKWWARLPDEDQPEAPDGPTLRVVPPNEDPALTQ
jgi:hypothetical protein